MRVPLRRMVFPNILDSRWRFPRRLLLGVKPPAEMVGDHVLDDWSVLEYIRLESRVGQVQGELPGYDAKRLGFRLERVACASKRSEW